LINKERKRREKITYLILRTPRLTGKEPKQGHQTWRSDDFHNPIKAITSPKKTASRVEGSNKSLEVSRKRIGRGERVGIPV